MTLPKRPLAPLPKKLAPLKRVQKNMDMVLLPPLPDGVAFHARPGYPKEGTYVRVENLEEISICTDDWTAAELRAIADHMEAHA